MVIVVKPACSVVMGEPEAAGVRALMSDMGLCAEGCPVAVGAWVLIERLRLDVSDEDGYTIGCQTRGF